MFDEHSKQLVRYVKSQEVVIPSISLIEISEWLTINVGEKRMDHPLGEAECGWIEHFKGEWAVRYITDEDKEYDKNVPKIAVWFYSLEKAALFKLFWA